MASTAGASPGLGQVLFPYFFRNFAYRDDDVIAKVPRVLKMIIKIIILIFKQDKLERVLRCSDR